MGEQDAWIRDGSERGAARAEPIGADDDALELLNAVAGPPERAAPNLRPKPAAALILVDRAENPPRILMGRRNSSLAFMADKFVFPGGRVDRADRRMTAQGRPPADTQRALLAVAPNPDARRALALAAIRETWEETGLLLGARMNGPPPASPPGPWRAFSAQGVAPQLDRLELVARAITPPGRVRRYDTCFFAADATCVVDASPRNASDQDELVDVSWIALDEIDRLPLAAITRVVLREFAARQKGPRQAALPVPFYRQIKGRWRRETL